MAEAEIFKFSNEFALRTGEAKQHFGRAVEVLVLDVDEDRGPEREIEAAANSGELVYNPSSSLRVRINIEFPAYELVEGAELTQTSDHRHGQHRDRNPLFPDWKIGDFKNGTFPERAQAGDGIEGCIYNCLAPFVFFQDLRNRRPDAI